MSDDLDRLSTMPAVYGLEKASARDVFARLESREPVLYRERRLTLRQAAELLGVDAKTMHRRMRAGMLTCDGPHREDGIGGTVCRISLQDLTQMLEKHPIRKSDDRQVWYWTDDEKRELRETGRCPSRSARACRIMRCRMGLRKRAAAGVAVLTAALVMGVCGAGERSLPLAVRVAEYSVGEAVAGDLEGDVVLDAVIPGARDDDADELGVAGVLAVGVFGGLPGGPDDAGVEAGGVAGLLEGEGGVGGAGAVLAGRALVVGREDADALGEGLDLLGDESADGGADGAGAVVAGGELGDDGSFAMLAQPGIAGFKGRGVAGGLGGFGLGRQALGLGAGGLVETAPVAGLLEGGADDAEVVLDRFVAGLILGDVEPALGEQALDLGAGFGDGGVLGPGASGHLGLLEVGESLSQVAVVVRRFALRELGDGCVGLAAQAGDLVGDSGLCGPDGVNHALGGHGSRSADVDVDAEAAEDAGAVQRVAASEDAGEAGAVFGREAGDGDVDGVFAGLDAVGEAVLVRDFERDLHRAAPLPGTCRAIGGDSAGHPARSVRGAARGGAPRRSGSGGVVAAGEFQGTGGAAGVLIAPVGDVAGAAVGGGAGVLRAADAAVDRLAAAGVHDGSGAGAAEAGEELAEGGDGLGLVEVGLHRFVSWATWLSEPGPLGPVEIRHSPDLVYINTIPCAWRWVKPCGQKKVRAA